MKKLLIAFMLLAVLVVPMFAEEKTMTVQTVVDPIEDFAFTTVKYDNANIEIGNKVSAVETIDGNDTFFVAIRTNAHKGYKITLTHEDLKRVDDETDTIALKLNNQNSGTPVVVLNEAAANNLRKYAQSFSVTYDSAEFAAATVGTYQATITMTITPNS